MELQTSWTGLRGFSGGCVGVYVGVAWNVVLDVGSSVGRSA